MHHHRGCVKSLQAPPVIIDQHDSSQVLAFASIWMSWSFGSGSFRLLKGLRVCLHHSRQPSLKLSRNFSYLGGGGPKGETQGRQGGVSKLRPGRQMPRNEAGRETAGWRRRREGERQGWGEGQEGRAAWALGKGWKRGRRLLLGGEERSHRVRRSGGGTGMNASLPVYMSPSSVPGGATWVLVKQLSHVPDLHGRDEGRAGQISTATGSLGAGKRK
jgi:hypothetical protein